MGSNHRPRSPHRDTVLFRWATYPEIGGRSGNRTRRLNALPLCYTPIKLRTSTSAIRNTTIACKRFASNTPRHFSSTFVTSLSTTIFFVYVILASSFFTPLFSFFTCHNKLVDVTGIAPVKSIALLTELYAHYFHLPSQSIFCFTITFS